MSANRDQPALFAAEHPRADSIPPGPTRLAVEDCIELARRNAKALPEPLLPALRTAADFLDELARRVRWPRNGMTAFPQILREYRDTYAAVFGVDADDDHFADALAAFAADRAAADDDPARPIEAAG